MPRLARLDSPGVLHHITIRGIERRKIFSDSFSPSSPLYDIRVRPIKREPDMFYVNKYMKYVEKALFT